jgi:hypothetical protein
MPTSVSAVIAAAIAAIAAVALTACGLNVSTPDLFLLTRTGQGNPLTLLVNDDGTIRCNGGKAKMLANQLLLQARDLSSTLDKDARRSLRLPRTANTVFDYTIKLPDGTITFPDRAGASRPELAQAQLFAVQAAQSACGLS